MNNKTEAKLTDLSGFNKAINGILQQAWERGRKYQEKLDEEAKQKCNKFKHILQDGDELLPFTEDLEKVANKYGLTFITCGEDDGALVVHFDELD